jgi:hypothetical protein
VVDMSKEPYEAGLIKRDIFIKKRDIIGELVALVDLTLESRGLELIVPRSRAVLVNEIHELILTDEKDAGPGKIVNHVSVIGFFEVKTGGIIVVGDKVSAGNKIIGEIAGFDFTHMPNHMNIVIKADTFAKLDLRLGEKIIIGMCKKSKNAIGSSNLGYTKS